jgi:putative nucleotidyltransferase with HDIG domain
VHLEGKIDIASSEARERRKRRVQALVSNGLPVLPSYVIRLDSLLSSSSVDLNEVTKIIRGDSSLSSQILGLANLALSGHKLRTMAIPEAVVLLGSERLRTLVLSCAFVKFSGCWLSRSDVQTFWQHSFLTASLSKKTAQRMAYPETEQAYVAGLLHDIGRLPLLIVAREEEEVENGKPPANWLDEPPIEREYFGLDHCEVGQSLGAAWKLSPSLIDVLENHHTTSNAIRDSSLVEIVAAADHHSNLPPDPNAKGEPVEPAYFEGRINALLRICLPRAWDPDRAALAEILRNEQVDNTDFSRFS